jgi:hypothetical protein
VLAAAQVQAIRWWGATKAGARREMDRSLPVAAVVAVVLMCCSGICLGERLGARECEDLGFTGLALCSDCNALSEFVKDQGTGVFWPGAALQALLIGSAIRSVNSAKVIWIRMPSAWLPAGSANPEKPN